MAKIGMMLAMVTKCIRTNDKEILYMSAESEPKPKLKIVKQPVDAAPAPHHAAQVHMGRFVKRAARLHRRLRRDRFRAS